MKRALFLLLSSSIVDGINPVVACTEDSQCLPGYFCQGGGCQAAQRVCDGPGDTRDCEADETCTANPVAACTTPTSGQDCPAAYVCERTRTGTTSGGSTGSTGGSSGTTGGACTNYTCSQATTFFGTYCTPCHSWTCSSPASDPNIAVNIQNGTMPPQGSTQPTNAEANAIVQWINCGSP